MHWLRVTKQSQKGNEFKVQPTVESLFSNLKRNEETGKESIIITIIINVDVEDCSVADPEKIDSDGNFQIFYASLQYSEQLNSILMM